MATDIRDRFHASARELFRNLEEIIMTSSPTHDHNNLDDDDNDLMDGEEYGATGTSGPSLHKGKSHTRRNSGNNNSFNKNMSFGVSNSINGSGGVSPVSPASTFEFTVRTIFSSCMGSGATANVVTPVTSVSYSSSELSNSRSDDDDHRSPTPTENKRRSTMPSTSWTSSFSQLRISKQQHQENTSESPLQKTHHNNVYSTTPKESQTLPHRQWLSPPTFFSPSAAGVSSSNFGEHIYEQLFYDDFNNRGSGLHATPPAIHYPKEISTEPNDVTRTAAKTTLNNHASTSRPSYPSYVIQQQRPVSTLSRTTTKPFPLSSPILYTNSSNNQEAMPENNSSPPPPPSIAPLQNLTKAQEWMAPSAGINGVTLSFDDGISAISAHTLELMAAIAAEQSAQLSHQQEHHVLHQHQRALISSYDKPEVNLPTSTSEYRNPEGIHQHFHNGPLRSKFSQQVQQVQLKSSQENSFARHPQNPSLEMADQRPKLSPEADEIQLIGASSMPRVRSDRTWNSGRHSTPTKNSSRTMQTITTTQSSSNHTFEQWKMQEQQFWSDQVNNNASPDVKKVPRHRDDENDCNKDDLDELRSAYRQVRRHREIVKISDNSTNSRTKPKTAISTADTTVATPSAATVSTITESHLKSVSSPSRTIASSTKSFSTTITNDNNNPTVRTRSRHKGKTTRTTKMKNGRIKSDGIHPNFTAEDFELWNNVSSRNSYSPKRASRTPSRRRQRQLLAVQQTSHPFSRSFDYVKDDDGALFLHYNKDNVLDMAEI